MIKKTLEKVKNTLGNVRKFLVSASKLNKKAVPLFIGALVVIIPVIYLSLRNTQEVEAAWWDDDWSYRKPVDVESTNGSAQSNVYISFDDGDVIATDGLISAGKMQSDCGDLRFTTQNGVVLPYYIVSGCNTASTDINVNFDNFPDGDQLIYFYYGNAGAPNVDNLSDFDTHASNYTIGTPGGTEETGPGPVAYWKFDEGYGTTAYDSMGNNNGTLGVGSSAPSWQSEEFCISEKCLYFDGTDDLVVMPNTAPSIQSVSLWAKPATTSEQFIDLNGSAYIDSSSGTVSATGFTDPTIYVDGVESSTITANDWQHITVTTDTAITASDINLAKISTNHGNIFLDEVKLYPYARTAAQIKADYVKGGSVHGASITFGDDESYLSDGLVGYWKLDESSGDASNSSGNDLTLTNNGGTTYTKSKFGNGSEHVPASSQYLSTTTDINGVKSVSFWVNPDSTTNYYIDLNGSAYIDSSGAISTTGFTDPTIYVNGVQTTSISADSWQLVTVTTETAINATDFRVGRISSNYFDGTMDEVRLYNRTLTSGEVKKLYEWAPGPIAHWKMNEGSWTNDCSTDTVFDSSGNGHHGDSCPNSTGPTGGVIGKYGKGGLIDGLNDYITVPDHDDLSDLDSITVEAWVKIDGLTGNAQGIVTKRSITGNYEWQLIMQNSRVVRWGIFNGGGNEEQPIDSTITLQDDTWYHIAATFEDSTNTSEMYINGALHKTSNSITYAPDNVNSGSPVWIGEIYGGSYNLKGTIDDARIYNYVRTPKQIVQDMNAGHPAPGSPIGSQTVYWTLDDGYGSTALDKMGNSDGTINNSPTWEGRDNCTKNGCLSFDLATESVSIATANDSFVDFNGSEEFSASAWVYTTHMPDSGQQDAIIAKWDETSNQRGYRLFLENDDTDTTGNFQVEIYDESVDEVITATGLNDVINENTWYHVGFTFNGGVSGDAGDLNLYVNGELVGSNSTNASFLGLEDVTSDFTVAEYDATDVVSTNTFFTGFIDEVKVYSSALTTSQMQIDTNVGSGVVFGTVGGSETSDMIDVSIDDPIGYWKMDEGSGSTIADSSGNGYTGNLGVGNSAPTWKTSNDCKKRTCLEFDDTNDYVDFGEIYNSQSLPITISAWVYRQSSSAGPIFSSDNEGDWYYGFLMFVNSDDKVVVRYGDGTGKGSTDRRDKISSATVNQNGWNHIVGNIRGSQSMDIYINGVNAGGSYSGTGGVMQHLSEGAPAKIGAWEAGSGGPYFSGDIIDEVKMFDFSLSATQIAYEYNNGAPIAHWKLDEKDSQTVYDSTGVNGSGTLGSSSSSGESDDPTWLHAGECIYGSCLSFDGDDFVDLGAVARHAHAPMTIEMWIKKPTAGLGGYFFSTNDYASAYSGIFLFTNTSDNISIAWGDGGGTGSADRRTKSSVNNVITPGEWTHVAAILKTAGNMSIYVNGRDVGGSYSGTGLEMYNEPSSNGKIGVWRGNYFTGLVDDIRIYGYDRTLSQISYDYNGGAPIGWWKLDECQGSTAYDSSGSGNNGTINAGDATGDNDSVGTCDSGASDPTNEMWNAGTTGKRNASLDFDDTNDEVSVADDSALDLTNGLSVAAWVKTSATEADNVIVSKGLSYEVGIDASGNVYWDGVGSAVNDGSGKVGSGTWHHVVVTNDDTTATFYVDGVQTGTSSAGVSSDNSTSFRIGYDGTNFFDGQIDDVRVYNHPLTQQQVRNAYNEGTTVRFGPETGSP